jgi:hypothetical protein
MTSTNINLAIFNDFFVSRLMNVSNLSVNVDNSNIYINAPPFVAGASNIGGDTNGFFINQVGNVLLFKNLLGGNGISIVDSNTTVALNFTSNFTNLVVAASNIGGDTNGVFSNTTQGILMFKGLNAGTFVSIISTDSIIMLNSTYPFTNIVTGSSNMGGGIIGISATQSGSILRFKPLVSGALITYTDTNSTISINSSFTLTNAIGSVANIGGFSGGAFSFNNPQGILMFNNLVGGTFIQLRMVGTSAIAVDNLYVNSNIIIGATNIAGGINGPFRANLSGVLLFKNIVSSSNIVINDTASTINLNILIPTVIMGMATVSQPHTTVLLSTVVAFSTIFATTPIVMFEPIGDIGSRYLSSFVQNVSLTTVTINTKMLATYMGPIDNTFTSPVGSSMEILNSGYPAIAFNMYANNNGRELKYARSLSMDGTGAWITSVVDTNVRYRPSLCILSTGQPAIAYTNNSDLNIRYAINSQRDGSGAWTINRFSTAALSRFPVMVVLSNGLPSITHTRDTNLVFSYNGAGDASGVWTTITIGSVSASAAVENGYPSAYVTSAYKFVVSYQDGRSNILLAATANAIAITTFSGGIVDGTAGSGRWSSAGQNMSGFPAIAYYQGSLVNLKFAVSNTNAPLASGWTNIFIDTTTGVGEMPSLNLMNNGTFGVSYRAATGTDLKYAYSISNVGVSGWTSIIIDSDNDSGYYSTLRLINNNPSISHWDDANNTLRLVRSPMTNIFLTTSASFVLNWTT